MAKPGPKRGTPPNPTSFVSGTSGNLAGRPQKAYCVTSQLKFLAALPEEQWPAVPMNGAQKIAMAQLRKLYQRLRSDAEEIDNSSDKVTSDLTERVTDRLSGRPAQIIDLGITEMPTDPHEVRARVQQLLDEIQLLRGKG